MIARALYKASSALCRERISLAVLLKNGKTFSATVSKVFYIEIAEALMMSSI
jgi:hypothetical protein